MMFNADIAKIQREYIPQDFKVSTWANLEVYFKELQGRPISNVAELIKWLNNCGELSAVISEDYCWRQINMTRDTTNKEFEQSYTDWCTHLQGPIAAASNKLNEKLVQCAYTKELPSEYNIYLRGIKVALELFREENLPLISEESLLAQQYGQIVGAMTVNINGEDYTLPAAAKFLRQGDRALRKTAYEAVNNRRLQDKDQLNELFDKLLNIRHQIAVNAGFDNYRDYKFKELGRFDYDVAACTEFHEAIRVHILPLAKQLLVQKKQHLQLSELRPYDIDAVAENEQPLVPFADANDLIEKSIAVFDKLGPFFGDCLRKMKAMQHLDLDTRVGKAPGGYNCPLAETGVPFIFMNAANTADDMVTMMHEGGHAIHSFVCHPLAHNGFKEYPMEIAELASMSMELISMKHWHIFYDNKDDLRRAKLLELDRAISVLPWIAIIDKFQHWLYTHVGHSVQEREDAWLQIVHEFSVDEINYEGYEHYRANQWQKQLHLFEVPFYYIEYGIAQVGALAMWRQYQKDEHKCLENYLNALSLGYTKDLKTLYKTAGIEFDFSTDKVKEISEFVAQEMKVIAEA